MAESEQSEQDKRETIRKIVNGARTAFMVTRTEGEGMHGRPMATAKVDKAFENIWFATSRDSGKISELRADSHVYLGYTNASGSEWASINGRARVVDDRAKIHEFWSPIWKNWFSGPDDPKLVLVQVIPESAEFWDEGSQMVAPAKFAIADVTGKHVDEGEHEPLSLRR